MVHGEVKRSFDPKLFEWKRGQEGWGARTDMKIRISERGQIFLSSAAAKKFKEYAEPSEAGFYRAEIGIAKKAIAIRPVPFDSMGYRFRENKGMLVCNCRRLVKSLEWELPLKLVATWDAKHNMLVAKVE